jgi:hypothetical protein
MLLIFHVLPDADSAGHRDTYEIQAPRAPGFREDDPGFGKYVHKNSHAFDSNCNWLLACEIRWKVQLFVSFIGQILHRSFFGIWEKAVNADFGIPVSANVLNTRHSILCVTRLHGDVLPASSLFVLALQIRESFAR